MWPRASSISPATRFTPTTPGPNDSLTVQVSTRREKGALRVRLNPFGSYWGRQYRYPTADTGLGNLLATTFSAADHIKPYAPSYNGRVQEFSLLIAPYSGDAPPDAIRYDAEAFAYPYIVLNDGEFIAAPAHRGWDSAGVGKVP